MGRAMHLSLLVILKTDVFNLKICYHAESKSQDVLPKENLPFVLLIDCI